MNNFIELWSPQGCLNVTYSQFPGGEEYVKIEDICAIKNNAVFTITVLAADSKTIIQSIMLADAIKIINPSAKVIGSFPYIPYGRQDRACLAGESFSLKVFEEIIKLRFDSIQSYDMHSKISETMFTKANMPNNYISFKGGVISEPKPLQYLIPGNSLFVAPDLGATERANSLSGSKVAVISKTRTGSDITQTADKSSTDLISNASNIVIADDICDGGGTFLSAAKLISSINPKAKLYLVISHGIFSKGTKILLDKYENVIVIDDKFNRLNFTK